MANAALMQLLGRWVGAHDRGPDASFLTRFLTSRDQDAFAALVHRHGPLVYGTCRRILGNCNDIDDAFQAVFFVLARRAHTLKLDRSIGPWLHGVAVRVAKKLRGQVVKRRLREMAAAKSERVELTEPNHDFWAIIDEELACMALPLREALLLCDLSGQSHAQTAELLGLAKGTITKRLAKAREELARRLTRRGITLGAAALASMIASQAPASVPPALVLQTATQAVAFSLRQVAGSIVARNLAEGVMRSYRFSAFKVWLVVGLLGLTLAGGGFMLAGGPDDPGEPKRPAQADVRPDAGTMWMEKFTAEHDSNLPVSVALSADGKTLLVGDTSGEVTAVMLPSDPPTYRWKSKADGSHAVVAYSLDQKKVFATTTNGVRILDAASGNELGRIDAPNSNPMAIGVFPNKDGRAQIAFGNARRYFVKSWAEGGNLPETMATIEVNNLPKDAKPADVAAVPLAVDPKGRSAIMTGPRDATGQLTGVKGKNVLWAYVCGDYAQDSPGNRVMTGHTATVVAAAWSADGSTAVTGDADGRVIVWDAKTMKETRRVELGGRVGAVALSPDGTHTAASVRGKQGGEVYAWETAKTTGALKPIHTQAGDFGSEPFASLTFSADGKRLAGCVIDKKWLQRPATPLLGGQVHVWELAVEPKAQPAPKQLYTKPLPKGTAGFVIVNNFTFYKLAEKGGAIDFHDIRDGHIQGRIGLGKFTSAKMSPSPRIASGWRWSSTQS
jgi:RNA polymerase sigma factor (sigma-70 family)